MQSNCSQACKNTETKKRLLYWMSCPLINMHDQADNVPAQFSDHPYALGARKCKCIIIIQMYAICE